MNAPIQLKKILAFPSCFLPYYISSCVIKHMYRKSPNRLYTASRGNLMRNRLIYLLEKKFAKEIKSIKLDIDKFYPSLPHFHCRKIWVCWFQGIENAPLLVKKCYEYLCKNLGDKYEIVLLTKESWRDFADIPDDIIEMWEQGVIGNAHFADVLRLALLVRYGGTWIDATVLCTDSNPPDYMLQSDLFIVQTMIPDRWTFATQIENYFISASQNGKIITLALRLMYAYWRKYDFLLDYHISYDILQIAIEQYPEEWNRVVPFPRARTETFESSWDLPYEESVYKAILAGSPFHKLSYKHRCSDESLGGHFLKKCKGEEQL